MDWWSKGFDQRKFKNLFEYDEKINWWYSHFLKNTSYMLNMHKFNITRLSIILRCIMQCYYLHSSKHLVSQLFPPPPQPFHFCLFPHIILCRVSFKLWRIFSCLLQLFCAILSFQSLYVLFFLFWYFSFYYFNCVAIRNSQFVHNEVTKASFVHAFHVGSFASSSITYLMIWNIIKLNFSISSIRSKCILTCWM